MTTVTLEMLRQIFTHAQVTITDSDGRDHTVIDASDALSAIFNIEHELEMAKFAGLIGLSLDEALVRGKELGVTGFYVDRFTGASGYWRQGSKARPPQLFPDEFVDFVRRHVDPNVVNAPRTKIGEALTPIEKLHYAPGTLRVNLKVGTDIISGISEFVS